MLIAFRFLCEITKFKNLTEHTPVRHASLGHNLMWVPGGLRVGDVMIDVEFNFEELEELPEKDKFHIPPNTTVADFVDHLCIVYPDIEEYREELGSSCGTFETLVCIGPLF